VAAFAHPTGLCRLSYWKCDDIFIDATAGNGQFGAEAPTAFYNQASSMKLSARNVVQGKVVAVTQGATTAHVKIELSPGLTITSSITNESVDDLALKVGDSVSAIIKSSDVIIGK
jgi:molybdopterin-binding protein